MTTVGGDVTGVMAMLRRECWNGGSYVTTVGGGITGMTRDLQGHRRKRQAFPGIVNTINQRKK